MRLSISKIKMFKSCRRQYQLHYVEGLTPVATPDALAVGRKYHELLEGLYNTGSLPPADGDWSKELAMATAYQKYIYPNFAVKAAEEPLTLDLGDGDELYGIADGIAEDGSLVEHKTVSKSIDEGYEYDLMWDQQMLAYMFMTGSREIYYTVCQKPTIRQKKNESAEEFFERMVAWYDEDTDTKIRLLKLYRTDEEIIAFGKELYAMRLIMKLAESSDEESEIFYRNQTYCNMWGRRCEYAPICLHYDPDQMYADFVKKED